MSQTFADFEHTVDQIYNAAKKFHSMVSMADGEGSSPQPDPEVPVIPLTPAAFCLKLAFDVWQEWLDYSYTDRGMNFQERRAEAQATRRRRRDRCQQNQLSAESTPSSTDSAESLPPMEE